MRSDTAELMAKIYETAEALEHASSPERDGLVARLLGLSRSASEAIMTSSPLFPWAEFGYLTDAGGDRDFLERELKLSLPRLKAGVLQEFGLASGTLIFHGRTAGCYAVIFDTPYKGRTARMLFMDGALSSAEFDDGSSALEYPAFAEKAFGLAQEPSYGLVLGVAGGTLVEMLKRSFPSIRVDGVDIDPQAMELGKRYFSLKEDSRTSLHAMDARSFVEGARRRYGIVLQDTFSGLSPLPHLSTVEFVRRVKAAMEPEGVCIVNIIARLERAGYLQHAYGTYRSVFRNVLVIPVGAEGEVYNVVLAATDRDVEEFEERNRGSLYSMRFDPDQVMTDQRNKLSELAPY